METSKEVRLWRMREEVVRWINRKSEARDSYAETWKEIALLAGDEARERDRSPGRRTMLKNLVSNLDFFDAEAIKAVEALTLVRVQIRRLERDKG